MKNKIISYYGQAQFYLMCLLALFPVTGRGVHSTLIIIMGIIAVFYFFLQGRKVWTRRRTLYLCSLGSLFLIYTISLLHLGDFTLGNKMIIRTVPILLLPLTFLNNEVIVWTTQKLKIILYIYISSVFLLLCYLHVTYFEEMYKTQFSSWELRSLIETFLKIHGTYLSMWIGMAVIASLRVFFYYKKVVLALLLSVFIGYFLYWQYILGARMPFFATLLASGWFILSFFKISTKKILILFSILFLLGSVIFWKPIIHKIDELNNYEKAIPEGKYENTNPLISNENIRSVVYYCAIQNIKLKPLLGFGIGNIDNQLQECYDSEFNHTDLFTRFFFNAHSQYFQVLLAAGLCGFLIYLLSIISWIRWSSGNLYLPFLILMFFCFMFENILSRHDGIVFFSFFNSVLFFSNDKTSE